MTNLGWHAAALGDYRTALGRCQQALVQALAVLDDLHDPDAAQVESRLDDLRAAL